MTEYEATSTSTLTTLHRLLSWWRSPDPNEHYLAEATDHADLERRQRVLERADSGPAVVTFNH